MRKWKDKEAYDATYLTLLEVFSEARYVSGIDAVCEVLKRKKSERHLIRASMLLSELISNMFYPMIDYDDAELPKLESCKYIPRAYKFFTCLHIL